MAIMALNIAYHGDSPPLFYGQNYMGSLEAYLGALFFHLAGSPSLFLLRLGIIVLVACFFFFLYRLSSLLFSRGLALVTLLVMGVGSSSIFMRQIIATGGTAETLVFGTLAFLLASWLALTYQPGGTVSVARLVAYLGWGLVVGLGFWSDMVVLPFLAMAGLLLVLFCWRELLPWRWSLLILGIIIGMLPLLIYNIDHGLNPLSTLLGLTEGSNTRAPRSIGGIAYNIFSTIQVSIPIATSMPFCPVMEVPAWGATTLPDDVSCIVMRASWGTGYLLLLGIALLGILSRLRSSGIRTAGSMLQLGKGIEEQRQELVRLIARLLLLGGAVLAIVVYMLSSGPVDQPGFHARYLVSLLIATPALLAPLWSAAVRLKTTGLIRLRVVGARVVLGAIWLLLCCGTVLTLLDVPQVQQVNQQRQELVNRLQEMGITHFYTDYWTCYDLIVESKEELICAVLDPPQLQPTHNRAPRYYDLVQNNPQAALVFPRESVQLPLIECQFIDTVPAAYQRHIIGKYIVYQPVIDEVEQPIDLRQAIGPDGVQKWQPGCGPATVASGKLPRDNS